MKKYCKVFPILFSDFNVDIILRDEKIKYNIIGMNIIKIISLVTIAFILNKNDWFDLERFYPSLYKWSNKEVSILKENDKKNWTSCDSDSLYYKSKIIYLDDIQDFKCWKYVTWNFKSLKKFWLLNGEKKHGLTKTTILTKNNFYRFSIQKVT